MCQRGELERVGGLEGTSAHARSCAHQNEGQVVSGSFELGTVLLDDDKVAVSEDVLVADLPELGLLVGVKNFNEELLCPSELWLTNELLLLVLTPFIVFLGALLANLRPLMDAGALGRSVQTPLATLLAPPPA